MKAVFVRALWGDYADIFKNNGFVAIGWFKEPVSDYSDKSLIIEHYKKHYPDSSAGSMFQNVGQIFRFWNDIEVGDIVISTYNDGRLLIGVANSQPYFSKDAICEFYDRINVDWKPQTFNRADLSISAQNTIKSSLTVFNVSQVTEIANLAKIKLPPQLQEIKKEVTLKEEDIYKSIKDVLLKLDHTEFEIFVAYILQSLGFEAKQQHGGVGDGGIDFEGVLDVMGIATTQLQVQVKRFENNTITEKEIRNFRGALKRDYQGTFITLSNFNKKAKESASDSERTAIHLINGQRLVEIFIQQYDKVMELMEADEANELLQKLKFKKIIIPN
ncbi:MAG: restriction endonuclease [bacterium]